MVGGKCYHWISREAAGNFISVMAGDVKLFQYQMDQAAYTQIQQIRQKLQSIFKCIYNSQSYIPTRDLKYKEALLLPRHLEF